MAENKETGHELDELDLRTLFGKLCRLNEGMLFSDIFPAIWRIYSPDEDPNQIIFESFLIHFVQRITRDETHSGKHKQIGHAKDHDRLLLCLGLLDGYYHTEKAERLGRVSVSMDERIARYAEENNLDVENTKKSIKKFFVRAFLEDAQNKERDPKYFYYRFERDVNAAEFQKYIKRCEKEPPETITLPNGSKRIKLPKPRYTADNLSDLSSEERSKTKEIANSREDACMISGLVKSPRTAFAEKTKNICDSLVKNLKEKRGIILAFSLGILLGVAVAFLVIVPHRNLEANERSAENKAYNIYLNVGINNIYNGGSSMDDEAEDSENANTIVDGPIDHREAEVEK